MDLSCKLVTLVLVLVSVAVYAMWVYMELHGPLAAVSLMWGAIFSILLSSRKTGGNTTPGAKCLSVPVVAPPVAGSR